MSQEYKTEDEYEMIPLEREKLTDELQKLAGWERISEEWIARKYTFDDYLDGVNFSKEIGEYAEKRHHHPFIQIDYKKVTVKISSWQAKGVTALDIEMVEDFNNIYDNFLS